jgi:hypothetical protein
MSERLTYPMRVLIFPQREGRRSHTLSAQPTQALGHMDVDAPSQHEGTLRGY